MAPWSAPVVRLIVASAVVGPLAVGALSLPSTSALASGRCHVTDPTGGDVQ